jgi:inositol transport system substrate-binding protein
VAQQMIKGEKVDSHQWIPFELVTPQNRQHYQDKNP